MNIHLGPLRFEVQLQRTKKSAAARRPGLRIAASLLAVAACVLAAGGPAAAGTSAKTGVAVRALDCPSDLIQEPGFEDDANTNAVWQMSGGAAQVSPDNTYMPDGGTSAAQVGGGTFSSRSLSQTITEPASFAGGHLVFWVHVATQETTTSISYDTLNLQLFFGSDVLTIDSFTNLDDPHSGRTHGQDKGTNWIYASYSMPVFHPGQPIQFVFSSYNDSIFSTVFWVDAVHIYPIC